MIVLSICIAFIQHAYAFECILDGDCRSTLFADINDHYCVNNKCSTLLPPHSPCKEPSECSSYSYFGPLACSANCGTKNECGSLYTEKTVYCCKPIPLKGKCNPSRPKSLNGCSKSHVCLSDNGIYRCSEKPEPSWFLGAFLSIAGNLLINLGINFQKRSYTTGNARFMGYNLNTLHLGIALYSAGKISSFSAYIFCNQSFLAGLSASGLVSNSMFAPIINDEIFTWNDATAIFLVTVGSLVIIANTNRSHTIYTICELLKMLRQTDTVLWIAFIFGGIASLFFLIKFVEMNSAWALANDKFYFLRSESIHFEENGFVMKYVMVIVYVGLSSFIASFTTLSVKILGEIANRYFNADGSIASLTTLFFSFTLFLCTLLQIYWLNRALKHFDALVVVPIFHMTWTILSILTAGIYFQDFETYSNAQLRYFLFGIIVIFSGSIFLGLKIKNKHVIRGRRVDEPEEDKAK